MLEVAVAHLVCCPGFCSKGKTQVQFLALGGVHFKIIQHVNFFDTVVYVTVSVQ